MSQRNVELVRSAFQAFNDRDWDAIPVLFTDDVVWRLIGGAVITRSVAAGGTSGTPATLRSGQVYFFRDRQISAVDNYYEVSDVLEAVGLPEQDAHADS
jgi:hypothetical protein